MSGEENLRRFRSVSIRNDLYSQLTDFFEKNKEELQRRRVYSISQLLDASSRCFMTCQSPLLERLF